MKSVRIGNLLFLRWNLTLLCGVEHLSDMHLSVWVQPHLPPCHYKGHESGEIELPCEIVREGMHDRCLLARWDADRQPKVGIYDVTIFHNKGLADQAVVDEVRALNLVAHTAEGEDSGEPDGIFDVEVQMRALHLGVYCPNDHIHPDGDLVLEAFFPGNMNPKLNAQRPLEVQFCVFRGKGLAYEVPNEDIRFWDIRRAALDGPEGQESLWDDRWNFGLPRPLTSEGYAYPDCRKRARLSAFGQSAASLGIPSGLMPPDDERTPGRIVFTIEDQMHESIGHFSNPTVFDVTAALVSGEEIHERFLL